MTPIALERASFFYFSSFPPSRPIGKSNTNEWCTVRPIGERVRFLVFRNQSLLYFFSWNTMTRSETRSAARLVQPLNYFRTNFDGFFNLSPKIFLFKGAHYDVVTLAAVQWQVEQTTSFVFRIASWQVSRTFRPSVRGFFLRERWNSGERLTEM